MTTTSPKVTHPADDGEDGRLFRVAVFGHVTDPDDVASLLSRVLGLNRIDARIHTRHLPGLLPETLEQWQADALVEVLFEHGLSATVFDDNEIPSLEHPHVVHHAACSANGLEVYGITGAETGIVAWDDLELISVGVIPQEPAHHSHTGPLIVVTCASHAEDDHVDTPPGHGLELWLVARSPLQVFRIDHRLMNYEYLGDQMTGSATSNFRLFVEEIVRRAPDAWQTPATHAWLANEAQHRSAFESSDALRQATLTHLLMHRAFERQR